MSGLLGKSPASSSGASMSGREEEAGAAVPQQHKSAFLEFIQQVASFSGDLSSMTAPSFLLNGISLLEYSAHYGDHPDLVQAMAASADPKERMLAMVKWFLSTLYGSFHERCANGSEKKPYNPILGEQFFCKWIPESDAEPWTETELIGEQVSHHPPINAFRLQSTKQEVFVTGYCGRKTKFKAMTVRSDQEGLLSVEIPKYQETATFTYPDLILRGLLSGNIFIELTNNTQIKSSSGYAATIEYLPKPWFYGEYHHVKATVFHQDQPTKIIYTVTGRWVDKLFVAGENIPVSGEPTLFLDCLKPRPIKHVRPIAEQGNLESRRVWHKVTEALLSGNHSAASKEKTEIEEQQRALRKQRSERQQEWTPKFFQQSAESSGNNATGSGSSGKKSKSKESITAGMVWRFTNSG